MRLVSRFREEHVKQKEGYRVRLSKKTIKLCCDLCC